MQIYRDLPNSDISPVSSYLALPQTEAGSVFWRPTTQPFRSVLIYTHACVCVCALSLMYGVGGSCRYWAREISIQCVDYVIYIKFAPRQINVDICESVI